MMKSAKTINKWHKTTCNVCCYSNLRNSLGFPVNNKLKCQLGHTTRVVRKGLGYEYQSTNCYLIINKIQSEKLMEKETVKK